MTLDRGELPLDRGESTLDRGESLSKPVDFHGVKSGDRAFRGDLKLSGEKRLMQLT